MSEGKLRCQHEALDKHGVNRLCNRYLGDISEERIYIRCPKCGGFTAIESADSASCGSASVETIQNALNSLQSAKKEK